MLPLAILSLTLGWLTSSVSGGEATFNASCDLKNNRLSPDTKQFSGDCAATLYCAENGRCAHKGCRKDEYPFGYRLYSHMIPDRCPRGQFCPDEEDACQPLMEVGALCQLNRDDQCQPPPNFKELAGPTNFNGSLCLNYQCMWANATLGNACVVENTPYVGYEAGTGKQYVNVVSRGNCVTGLYCDSVQLVCLKTLDLGQKCTADKECTSDNCTTEGICGAEVNASRHLPMAVYIIVGVCIVGTMAGILTGLYFLHKRHRYDEREKRAQYWREQEQFRQNIMQMREQARTSLLSLPWGQSGSQPNSPQTRSGPLDTGYPPSDYGSQAPMMYAASQPSGLRNEFSDEDYKEYGGSMDEGLVMRGGGGNGGGARGPAPGGAARRPGAKRI